MSHIFLSYCHDDADFVQILKEKLTSSGLGTWQDLDLQAGDAWSANIDYAIRNALAVVVVMSRQARSSEYVNYEWAFALGSGVPVIPILFKLGSDELHTRLRELHALDFSNFMARPWDDLTRRLKTIAEASRPFTVRTPRDAPPVVQKAAQSLDSLDPKDRSAAVQTLAQMNHQAARDVLVAAINHPVEDVRFASAIALAESLEPRAIPGLIAAIREGRHDEIDFAGYLRKFGEIAVPDLVEALKSTVEEPRVRRNAVRALAHTTAWSLLKDVVHDHDASVRRCAVEALDASHSHGFQPWLIECIADEDAEVRRTVIRVLGEFNEPSVVPALVGALRDSDSTVRQAAVLRLGRSGDPSAVAGLLGTLRDDEVEYVRILAAGALHELGDPAAVPGLLAAAYDDSSEVRKRVLRALGAIGGPAAVRGLIEQLHDPSPLHRSNAAYTLGEHPDLSAVPDLLMTLEDIDSGVRRAAAYALGCARAPAAVPSLLAALNDPEDDVRKSAADALGAIRDPAAVQGLITLLKCDYEEEKIRQAAAEALMSIRTPEARAAAKAWERQQNQH